MSGISNNQNLTIERGAEITVQNGTDYNTIASDGTYIGDGVNEVALYADSVEFTQENGSLSFVPNELTAARIQALQDKSGVIALLSDITTPTSLGNFLFVSPTGNNTQSRADGVGRIDKPFTLTQAIAVAQNNDVIYVFGNTNSNFPAITIDNPAATALRLTIIFVNASIFDININNTGSSTISLHLVRLGDAGVSRVRNDININGNAIQVIVDGVTVSNNVNIIGDNCTYQAQRQNISSTLSVTGDNANIKLDNCEIFLEQGAANPITTLEVQGGVFMARLNGIITGLMSVFGAKNGAANMIEFFGTTINIGANIVLCNCLHYYLPANGFLVKMDAVTTWTDNTKFLKILHSAASGITQNAIPAIAPQVDVYNIANY